MVPSAAAVSSERLLWAEICARHPDRWVVLGNVDWVSDSIEIISAELIGAFEQRAAASPTIKSLQSPVRELGCFWTGRLIPRGAINARLG